MSEKSVSHTRGDNIRYKSSHNVETGARGRTYEVPNSPTQVLFLLSKAMILLIEKNNIDEATEILETTTPILDSWIGTSTLTESLRVFELVLKV